MSSVWMKPITTPKAWRGGVLSHDPSSWIMTLTPAELVDIDQALGVAKASGKTMLDVGRDDFPLTATRPRLEQIGAELYDARGLKPRPGELYQIHARVQRIYELIACS